MQNKEKKPNPKRRSQRLDWILLALCLLSAALAFFLCYRMSVLPTRYLTILGLILVIAVLVSFLLCLCRLRRPVINLCHNTHDFSVTDWCKIG